MGDVKEEQKNVIYIYIIKRERKIEHQWASVERVTERERQKERQKERQR